MLLAPSHAASYSDLHGGRALLVYQGEDIIFEQYSGGAESSTLHPLYSCTKSLWATLAAAAVTDGLLAFDEAASATLAEWRELPGKAAVTVRHLLTMTSGLDPATSLLYDDATLNKYAAALHTAQLAPPGTKFCYGPANLELFGEILARKLTAEHLSPADYFAERLLKPLGIGDLQWHRDAHGNVLCSSGARMSARSLAAFGRLLLSGTFGAQQLIGREQVQYCRTATPANPMYGMTFWLNCSAPKENSAECSIETALEQAQEPGCTWQNAVIAKCAPEDAFAMLGSNGQRLYAIPSLGAVIVRLGSGTGFRDAEFLKRLL